MGSKRATVLLPALHCDAAHGRPRDRLADRLGVSRVGLPSLHIWFDVGRWHRSNFGTQFLQFARPMMRRYLGFHPDKT